MRVWTVHIPPGGDTPARQPAAPVLVREGFSWGAFLFGLPWLLANRLWLEAAGYLGLVLLLGALLPGYARLPVLLGLELLLGLEARDLRRAALARRGWTEAHVVSEATEDLALARLLAARPDLIPAAAAAA